MTTCATDSVSRENSFGCRVSAGISHGLGHSEGLLCCQQVKGCEQPGKRATKKQQEWLNTRQGAGKEWENGVKATGFLWDLQVPGDIA